MQHFRIGLAGLGVVGSGVVRNLERNGALITRRTGLTFEVVRAAVRDASRPRDCSLPADRITTDALALASDPEVDIVVELMGGTTLARQVVETALKHGKPVVTANKALLAEDCGALSRLACERHVPLCIEASVAGGIPIIKALREGLVANRIVQAHGIINGTCNFILSSIEATQQPFAEALAEAQRLGFAEADPTLDIGGFDAMHKACVLTALAYGSWPKPDEVYVEGISHLQSDDFKFAALLGYTIKLLAIIRSDDSGDVEVHVTPTFVPKDHVLANVSSSYNALLMRGDVVGDTLFYGRGAGSDPTASAVISDLVDAASGMAHRAWHGAGNDCTTSVRFKPFTETVSRYYCRISVTDKPGVLSRIAAVFAQYNIGISSVFQPREHSSEHVPLVLLLHDAQESNFRSALAEIAQLDVTHGDAVAIRVEDFDN